LLVIFLCLIVNCVFLFKKITFLTNISIITAGYLSYLPGNGRSVDHSPLFFTQPFILGATSTEAAHLQIFSMNNLYLTPRLLPCSTQHPTGQKVDCYVFMVDCENYFLFFYSLWIFISINLFISSLTSFQLLDII